MTDLHPIVPSEGLKEQWESEWHHYRGQDTYEEFMAKQAAQWGADAELDACCDWMRERGLHPEYWRDLRTARRPKPLSETDQALTDLEQLLDVAKSSGVFNPPDNIRRCLERLKKLEESTND